MVSDHARFGHCHSTDNPMTKKQTIFYIAIAIAALINQTTLAPLTFLPSLLIILLLAFKAFPAPSKE